nr:MAG TPA: hypothetical protein [Caudoviricetes sp.]
MPALPRSAGTPLSIPNESAINSYFSHLLWPRLRIMMRN